jgi:hypothetical protein
LLCNIAIVLDDGGGKKEGEQTNGVGRLASASHVPALSTFKASLASKPQNSFARHEVNQKSSVQV